MNGEICDISDETHCATGDGGGRREEFFEVEVGSRESGDEGTGTGTRLLH